MFGLQILVLLSWVVHTHTLNNIGTQIKLALSLLVCVSLSLIVKAVWVRERWLGKLKVNYVEANDEH